MNLDTNTFTIIMALVQFTGFFGVMGHLWLDMKANQPASKAVARQSSQRTTGLQPALD